MHGHWNVFSIIIVSRKFLPPTLSILSFLRLSVLMINYSVNHGCHDDNEDRA